MRRSNSLILGSSLGLLALNAFADIVHNDDVIVVGSHCVGFDCVNGESFGTDTLKLKENNLRIKFDDTSVAPFPARDWQITANDSTSGGLEKFSIDDITAGRTPFTIEGNAPTNSFYIESTGQVGFGTNNPAVEAHIVDGDTPTLRLEQDGTSGWTPQTWDMAGNETNFFIRDVTNGSKLPFRIRPNAPSSSLEIEGVTGDIGLGLSNPAQSLHVRRSNGTAQVFVEETSATAAPRTLLRMSNPGNTKFALNNTEASTEWSFANPGSAFRVSKQGSGIVEMELTDTGSMTIAGNGTTKYNLDNQAAGTIWGVANAGNSLRLSKQGSGDVELELFGNGNMTISGTLTTESDVNSKTKITPVDTSSVLSKVEQLPISQWEYKDSPGEAHIGPMAQDFYAAFGLGASETGISTMDTAGVALAAIKALMEQNTRLAERVEFLENEQFEMKVQMSRLLEEKEAEIIMASQ